MTTGKIFLFLLFLFLHIIVFPAAAFSQTFIDINSASVSNLEQLYRVGPVLAQRIVREREENGYFNSLDDIAERVSGVGPTMLSYWADVSNLPYSGYAEESTVSPQRAAELRALNRKLARGEIKLDLNAAPADEISLLYKVGSVIGERIVEERKKNGRFISLLDLSKRVDRVGAKMVEEWKPYVTLPYQSEEEKPAERFDINNAGLVELEGLYKVGPKLAARIIEERKANGSYSSLEDLCMRVKGVGPTIVGSWRERVTNRLRE